MDGCRTCAGIDDDPEERLRQLYAANAPALLAYALRRGVNREVAALRETAAAAAAGDPARVRAEYRANRA